MTVEGLAEGDNLRQMKVSSLGLVPASGQTLIAKIGYSRAVKVERLCQARPVPSRGLTGIPARIEEVLERKRQAILYGPPGVG